LPAKLQLRLLGTFDARLDGVPLERFRSAKVRALLAYLGVEAGRANRREALATLLWGEYPDANAQQSLSQALTNLRSLLAPLAVPGTPSEPLLSITGQSVQLQLDPQRLWVDVHAFDSLLATADRQHSSALEEIDLADSLEEAVALYQGPFLAGLSLPDSRGFEEWLMLHREQRHQAMMLTLERLGHHHLVKGRTELVRNCARRQLALEPWSESAHQTMMLALALEGQRGAALQQYEACFRTLGEELGIEPSVETKALARQIRDGVPSQAMTGSGLPPAPLVARERELARLDQSLRTALAGQGRVALVTGEAGTGKTALLGHFARRAQEGYRRLVVAGGRCGAYAGLGDPLLPFREILQALTGETQAGWSGGHGDPEQVRRLLALFPQAAEALLAEGPGLVGRLVSAESLAVRAETLAPPGAPWRRRLAEHLKRSRARTPPPLRQEALFGQVTRVLQAIAGKQPLLLLIDDLQWADVASLSLLFHLGRHFEDCRILVVGAYRPSEIALPSVAPPQQGRGARRPRLQAEDARHPLEAIVHEFGRLWGDIRVDLDQADGRRFVDALLDGEPNHLSEGFRARLARHTGGHALFTIELLRAFQERGDLAHDEEGRWVERPVLRWEGLPPRVEAVIAERVSRLPREGRRLLEAASVEGESFSVEVAARALGAEPSWAQQWLSGPLSAESRLVQALGVRSLPAGSWPLSRYRFAHALFQEYLYVHLDPVDRAHLHGEVGAALEGLCRDDEAALVQASPQLARHFEEAGRVLDSARYRLEAGRWAAKLAAYEEAIAHLERGLALLQSVTASRERLGLELHLCMAIGMSAMLQKGWQAPAHARALERLANLIQHPDLQDDPQRLTALTVLALSAGWSADPERTGRVGQQLLDLAQDDDQQPLMLGHWALGFSHWLRGQPVSARENLSRALTLYDPDANRPLGGLVAADPGVMAQAMLGAVLWQLGYPEQGRANLGQAVVRAQALDQLSSIAFAHYIAVMATSVVGRDVASALSHAQALQPLGQVSLVYRAWVETVALCGQADTGAAEPGPDQGLGRVMEAGSSWQAAGSGGGYAGLMLLQAEVCARAGQVEMGLRAIDQAQAWIERTGMQATQAEVWRIRGELLLIDPPDGPSRPAKSGQVEEAEASFQQALGIARAQQARLFELRAAVRLAQLWGSQDRRTEAHELLAGIYGWFTEGFDTVDLVEAKALLEELT
jgi:DNA-binding SARP family transcriptional activator/tetratricopeptide (TPR) repeat protein